MSILHKEFVRQVQDFPRLLLEKLLEQKVEASGVSLPENAVSELAEHILSGNQEKLIFENDGSDREILIEFTEDEVSDLFEALKEFRKNRLPDLALSAAKDTSKIVLKKLKKDWAAYSEWHEVEYVSFCCDLDSKWGDAIDSLHMLLTLSRELGEITFKRYRKSRSRRKANLREALIRLQARACQVATEIMTLMENGLADGAMARWRTLHEIRIVATFISDTGEEIAERYLDHEAVEAKRAMDAYEQCYKSLGYKPYSKKETKLVLKSYSDVIGKYGKEFASPYGWASHQLGMSRPTFADLEHAVGSAMMRSEYKMASYNIHATTKGIFFRLGSFEDPSIVMAGASDAGIDEPGQNTAITLAQISILLCDRMSRLDDLVQMQVLMDLMDETVQQFVRAGRRYRRDKKKLGRGSAAGHG